MTADHTAIELRLDAALFGHDYPATPRRKDYCSDWSLLPGLLDKCASQGWELSVYPLPWAGGTWTIEIQFTHREVYNLVDGEGATFPEALCRAIVAVLDVVGDGFMENES